jgi:hypothetical protein
MRLVMATIIALLVINLVDEQFNDARYTRAAALMFSQILRSFG